MKEIKLTPEEIELTKSVAEGTQQNLASRIQKLEVLKSQHAHVTALAMTIASAENGVVKFNEQTFESFKELIEQQRYGQVKSIVEKLNGANATS